MAALYAQVSLDSAVPALSHPFDYLVPEDLREHIAVGQRVRVPLRGRATFGYVIALSENTEAPGKLAAVSKIVSPIPMLTPEIYQLALSIAQRYAGVVSDVLRGALPKRVARVEKEFLDQPEQSHADLATDPVHLTPDSCPYLNHTEPGAQLLQQLHSGESPRAAVLSRAFPTAAGRFAALIEAAAATIASERSAIIMVPDVRDLPAFIRAVQSSECAQTLVPKLRTFSSADTDAGRYRTFLSLPHEGPVLLVGNRSAVFAPVASLGLIGLYDDADLSYIDPRAPYAHTRECALLRAHHSGAALVIAGPSLSVPVTRLIQLSWLHLIAGEAAPWRAWAPEVISTANEFEQERDPLAGIARIPSRAFEVIRNGLTTGAVLVQVAYKGYEPAVRCQECFAPGSCPSCSSTVSSTVSSTASSTTSAPTDHAGTAERAGTALVHCAHCDQDRSFQCSQCGSLTFRATRVGSARTATELAQAFKDVPTLESAGAHILDSVPAEACIVVATAGAEPEVPGGYHAVVLLDADAMLARVQLDTVAQCARSWLNALALIRVSEPGERAPAVVVSNHPWPASALVAGNPLQVAERELAARAELGMPPVRRSFAIEGGKKAVQHFLAALNLPSNVQLLEQEPYDQSSSWQAVGLFSYQQAPEVIGRIWEAKLAEKASDEQRTWLRIRIDPQDVL